MTAAILFLLLILLGFPQCSLDIYRESLFQHYRTTIQQKTATRSRERDTADAAAVTAWDPSFDTHAWVIYRPWFPNYHCYDCYLYKDPFLDIPTPRIRWVDPVQLIRHEHTSRAHLESLLAYLQMTPPNAPVPIPVVTASYPRVILDGHHRVAASRILGLKWIPVWEIDDLDEIGNWGKTLVRCYSQTNGRRMALHEVTRRAREGNIDWGVKGTRHVAYLPSSQPQTSGDMHFEVVLERVTPRVEWGLWTSSNDVAAVGAGDLLISSIAARELTIRVPGRGS